MESKDIDKISFDRAGWKFANLWVGFDKDREIKQEKEQEHGIEG